jgi:hypothetical protein
MEHTTIVTLTSIVVFMNIFTAVKAIQLALKFESGCVWVCQTIGYKTVMHILYGVFYVCTILVVLKGWTLFDEHFSVWKDMGDVFHIRTFAWIGENAGVAMLGYAVVRLLHKMSHCATARGIVDSQSEKFSMDSK